MIDVLESFYEKGNCLMSERHFRVVLGLWLILGLYLNIIEIVYALIGLLLFEGITNQRIPRLVTILRYGANHSQVQQTDANLFFAFEAERALRFLVALLVLLPLIKGLEILWWLPWFVGFALIGAGFSGICPMVKTLKQIGFR